jgi:eukaryotic-like serine/threonine-protein kinase
LVELGLVKEAKALWKVLPPSDTTLDKAYTEVEVGNAAEALADAQRRQATAPNDALMNAVYLPEVRAAVALREGKPEEAVLLLQAAAPYELRDSTVAYLRGQAYLAAQQGAQAAAEFGKIAGQPWLDEPSSPLAALALLGMARAYALDGNSDASKNEYQKFLTLWKDADTDLPVLQHARAEYAQIK